MLKNQREALQTITEFTAAIDPKAKVTGIALNRVANSTALVVGFGKQTVEVASRVGDIDLLGKYAKELLHPVAPVKKAKAKK